MEPVQSNPVTPSVSPVVEPVQSNPVTPSVSPAVEQPIVSNDFGFGEVAQSSGVNLDYLNSQDGNNMSYIDQVKSRIQNSSVRENASNYSSVDVNSQSVSVPVNMEVSSTNTIPSPTVAPDLLSAQLEPVEEKTVVKKKKSNIGLIIFIVILILILIGFGFYLYNVVF